ncbi:MAG: hypothetical protein HY287_10365 [Planctomycetes bacterium]|nr:hypothetical protein [Planctomycetota bacterium]MBI3834720.1 hypothetical protein [Planctomycetota bacterium]
MTIATTGEWIGFRSATSAERNVVAATTPLRRAASMTVGFIAAFIAIDFTLDRIPLPHIYGSRNMARWKCEMYERSVHPPDVAFIGCSYEWCGISPMIVDNEVRNSTGREAHSLNLSASAASSLTQFLIARRVVESGHAPRLVYLGVNPATLDASRRNWQINGLRALGAPRDLPLSWESTPEVFLEGVRTALFHSYRSWDDVRIMAGRFLLAAPLNPVAKLRDHDDGWAEWVGDDRHPKVLQQPESGDESGIHVDGFTGDYRNDSVNAMALRRAVGLLRDHGVEVRLLEMPLAPGRKIEEDPNSNATYRALVNQLADELRIPIIRAPANFATTQEFFDPVHMNADGAKRFSKWLAADVAKSLTASNASRTAQARP